MPTVLIFILKDTKTNKFAATTKKCFRPLFGKFFQNRAVISHAVQCYNQSNRKLRISFQQLSQSNDNSCCSNRLRHNGVKGVSKENYGLYK